MNYKKYDNDDYIMLVKYICEDDNCEQRHSKTA